MMLLQADLVVFIEIVLHVDPQRIKQALKTREQKGQLANLLFLNRRNSTRKPSGHCRAHALPPPPFLLVPLLECIGMWHLQPNKWKHVLRKLRTEQPGIRLKREKRNTSVSWDHLYPLDSFLWTCHIPHGRSVAGIMEEFNVKNTVRKLEQSFPIRANGLGSRADSFVTGWCCMWFLCLTKRCLFYGQVRAAAKS